MRGIPAATPEFTLPSRLSARRDEHFVGRAAELATLERCLDQVAGGERVVACVTGEPGIGKTRLAAEAAALTHTAGAQVLYGRAEQAVGVAYQPFVDALGEYAAGLSPGARARHLAGRGIVDRMLAAPGDPEPAALAEPGSERYVLFGGVTATIASIAADGPLAVVLDDLHWAAEPTILMLRHLIERSADLPLLLLLVWRGTDVDEDHPITGLLTDLAGEPRVERLELAGFGDDEVADCVEHYVSGLAPAARAAVAREVADRTAGNPLFVGEVLRHIAERDEGRAAAAGSIAQYGWPA